MRKSLVFYIVVLVLASLKLYAQNEIIVNAQVLPPYSPYISTYVDQPNKLKLTLINTTQLVQNVRLWVRIAGDNGVSGTTSNNFKPAQPIVLQPGGVQSIDFSSPETRNYFDASNIDLVGITKNQLIQNQVLPEGVYTICVKALDYTSGIPKSMDGTGCSAPFSLSYIDPPLIVQPFCGTDITKSEVQNVLFSWTPPATAPGNVQYEFQLKEVPNTMNPMDVIKNNVFPIIYGTTLTAQNVLVYTNALPQLVAGKKYVWRVRAKDSNNSVQFKNQGFSEPCWFDYKEKIVPINNINATLPTNFNNILPPNFSGSNAGNPFSFNPVIIKDPVNPNIFATPTASLSGKMVYKYAELGEENKEFAFRNANLVLKVGFFEDKGNGVFDFISDINTLIGYSNSPGDVLKDKFGAILTSIAATTTTDANGNYAFSFPSSYPFGEYGDVTINQNAFKSAGGGMLDKTIIGKNYTNVHVLAYIEIGAPHKAIFCQPLQLFNFKNEITQSNKKVVSIVRSQQFIAHLGPKTITGYNESKAPNQVAAKNMVGVKTYLLRKTLATTDIFPKEDAIGLPEEGDEGKTVMGMNVVASTTTDKDGNATFKRVVTTEGYYGNYTYYIYFEFNKDDNYNYAFTKPEYIHGSGSAPKFTFLAGNDNYELSSPKSAATNSQQTNYEYGGSTLKTKFSYHKEQRNWELNPKMPRIYGRVLDGDNNAKPIEGAYILLRSNFSTNTNSRLFTGATTTSQEQALKNNLNNKSAAAKETTYRSTNTNLGGSFSFDELPIMYDQNSMEPNGPKRGLLIIKKGYEPYENMPSTGWIDIAGKGIKVLKYGEQYSAGDIILKRQSEIKGRVVDESGNGITAYIHLNNDEVAEQTKGGGYFSELYATKISGKKQLVVIEANGYLNDTILLEVKNPIHDIGTIKMAKRKRVLTVFVKNQEDGKYLNGAKVEVLNVTTTCSNGTTNVSGGSGQLQYNVTTYNTSDCPLEAKAEFMGAAFLKFENGGMDDNIVYQLKITGPSDKNYEPVYVSTKISYSAGLGKIINVSLIPATCVSGVVKDNKGNAVAGAMVSMEQTVPFFWYNLPVGELSTQTDNAGKYTLRNVPLRATSQKIIATKANSGYIGDEWSVITKPSASNTSNSSSNSGGNSGTGGAKIGGFNIGSYTVPTSNSMGPIFTGKMAECIEHKFTLKEFLKMDLSKLLGFPIEVRSLKENGNNVSISGNFIQLKSNTQFSVDEKVKVPFTNIAIMAGNANAPSGKPVAVPVSTAVVSDAQKIAIKAGYYNASLQDDNYISVKKESDNLGSISGNVKLETTSMNNNDIGFDDEVYVATPFTISNSANNTGLVNNINYNFNSAVSGNYGSPDKKPFLKIIYADASKIVAYDAPNGFGLCNKKGNDVLMSISSFTKSALALQKTSRLKGNEIILDAILKTNIEGLTPSDMKIAIGEVKLVSGKLENEQKTYYNTIAAKMGQNWSLSANKWRIDQFGLRLMTGKVEAGIDVPYTNLIVTPTAIRTDQAVFKLDQLSIVNGKIPLNIKADNLALGYFYEENGVSKSWQFAAYNSDGAQVSEIKSLDGIATGQSLKVKSIFLYSNKASSFNTLPSTFNVHNIIAFTPSPKLVVNKNSFKINGTFRTDIPGTGDITASLLYDENLKVGIDVSSFQFKTGNIYYTFDKAKISNKYLFAEGKVFEPDVLPPLKIELNHFGLQNTNVKLKSVPENIIKSDGSGGLKNLIGGNVVSKSNYEWDTLKITGTTFGSDGMNDKKMDFNVTGAVVANNAEIGVDNIETPFGNMKWVYLMKEGALDGSMQIKNMDIGGLMANGSLNSRIGSKGWYFKAAGQVEIPNMGGGAMYALLGFYNSKPSGDLATGIGNFGCLPSNFQNQIKGFLFQGTIIKSIADVGGDILVAKGGVKVTASLGARVFGSFDAGGGSTWGLGVLANVNATAFLESPATCTSVTASADAQAMVNGTYVTKSKTLTLDGCISLEVKGSLYQCVPVSYVCPPLCVGDDVSKALGLNIKIDSNKNFNADAFFGTCTGNACKTN